MAESIIVIGAGMAGIMAARTLHDAGLDVVVLETRDRLGGRTHTDDSLGSSVDLGAATHPHFYATVHGAYETGVRAAREVIGIR